MVDLAARKNLVARQLSQGHDVEAARCPGAGFPVLHVCGCSSGVVSISRKASSRGSEECTRHHCPVCRCHITLKRVSVKRSSTWSRRVKGALNSSPALSGQPER